MKHSLYFREKITVNTDPQRRCYNGCNFSEEEVWTSWDLVCAYSDKSVAEDSAVVFKKINPKREYKVVTE